MTVDQRRGAGTGARDNAAGWFRLSNFRRSADGAYVNDRGWERLKQHTTENTVAYLAEDFQPCRHVSVFSRHNNKEIFYVEERGGFLTWQVGNGQSVANTDKFYVYPDLERYQPDPTQPGTQMVELGDIAVYVNGRDNAIKILGGERTSDFGFSNLPPACQPYDIDPTFRQGAAGVFANGPAVAAAYSGQGYYGLTPSGTSGPFAFSYKMSGETDTGCEGPLSDGSALSFAIATGKDDQQARYISILRTPVVAGTNIVRRNIYRSRQRAAALATSDPGDYFYVKTIYDNVGTMCSDHFPDSELTQFAPGYGGRSNETIVPTPHFNFGALWDGRLWIAGGDLVQSVMWSARASSFPATGYETFYAASRLTFGRGGRITALKAFGQYLLIFREFCVETVFGDGQGGYTFNTLPGEIGTTATNSVQSVPGFGVVFLSRNGFYLVKQGSDVRQPTLTVEKISDPIDNDLQDRINLSALPRACSVWNEADQEYWCHFCVDGDTEPTLGAVLHRDGNWTFRRGIPGTSGVNTRTFAISAMAYDPYLQRVVLAPVPYDSSRTDGTSGLIESGTWHNVGLQVWSGRHQLGSILGQPCTATDIGGGIFTYQFPSTDDNRPVSVAETTWLDPAPGVKKHFRRLELICMGTTYNTIELKVAYDGREGPFVSAGSKQVINSEAVSIRDNKFDAAYRTASKTALQAKWNTSRAARPREVRVAWDLANFEADNVKFLIQTNELISIVGFELFYDDHPTKRPVST